MRKNIPLEHRFWRGLTVLSFLAAFACLPFAPVRFGVVFFLLLFAGSGVMWLCAAEMEEGGRHTAAASRLRAMGWSCFLCWVFSFVIIEGCIWGVGARYDKEAENADYLLVLGAGLNGDQPSASLAARLDRAAQYLEEFPNTRAVMCGGQGPDEIIPEAVAMFRYLTDRGVSPERLLLEQESSNTLQNIAHAKTILDKLENGQPYTTAVLSNEFHLWRARKLMEQAGLMPYGVPAPTPNPALKAVYGIREYFSIAGLMATGRWN